MCVFIQEQVFLDSDHLHDVNILDLEVLFVLFISVIILGYVSSWEVKKGFSLS